MPPGLVRGARYVNLKRQRRSNMMLHTRTSRATTQQGAAGDEYSLSRPTSGSTSHAASPVPSNAPGCDHRYYDTGFSHVLQIGRAHV